MKFSGELLKEKEKIAVKVNYDTKYTLLIAISSKKRYNSKINFDKLLLTIDNDCHELGPCQFIPLQDKKENTGRLIFLEDLYDLEKLIFDKKNINLKTYFQSLGLLISQKKKIKDSFKIFTADLIYDLEIYRHFFDDLENKYQNESRRIKNHLDKIIINQEGRNFFDFFDAKLKELENQIREFTKEENEQHGYYFRRQVWHFIKSSKFLERTNTKPRGYAGDSEMMTYIYKNDYRGKSIFAKLMHKHPVETEAAQAVRNRRSLIAKKIKSIREEFQNQRSSSINFLSLACGPAFELKDIYQNGQDMKNLHCTLLDQDTDALDKAKSNVRALEKRFRSKIKVRFLTDSVRTMICTPDLEVKWGKFHFLYALGLFDYLTPPVARAVMKKIYKLLHPGGQLVIGNYHVKNPTRYYMEYWSDWVLYYRTEEDLLSLFDSDGKAEKSIDFEETGSQMFLQIKKPG